MLQTEAYRRHEITSEEIITRSRPSARRDSLRSSLGFANASSEEVATLVYPELRDIERSVWSQFLPTFYSRNRSQWYNYVFDSIPDQALEEIETARNLGIFTDLEIWTPERSRFSDPLAVGVLGVHSETRRFDGNARFFPIARWGESLASYEEIFAAVLERNMNGFSAGDHGPHVKAAIRSLFEENPDGGVFTVRSARWPSRRHCGKERPVVIERGFSDAWRVCPDCGTKGLA